MRILVTGKKGQLASEIHKISSIWVDVEWIFSDKIYFDLLNLEKIIPKLDKILPGIIINCAAYTSVVKSEKDFVSANTVNNKAVVLIAKWCKANNCKLIHISSDYVYDENSKKPLKEDYNTIPVNNYGKSKLMGEIGCIKHNPESIIIRTSWLYSSFGNNFVKKVISLITSGKDLEIINDQIGSPTYALDLATAIISIITHNKWIPGVYNYSNKGEVSWFDFAKDISAIYGVKNIDIFPKSSKDINLNLKRPKYTVLDNSKIKKTFDLKQLEYKSRLKECIKILKNE